jgi:hypothetical protein
MPAVSGARDNDEDRPPARDGWAVDAGATEALDTGQKERLSSALDVLIDGEAKLLAIYDARQASADARIAAFSTGAAALPTLTLSLTDGFTGNETLFEGIYVAVVVAAVLVLVPRAWNAWRRRAIQRDEALGQRRFWKGLELSAEAAAVSATRKAWRDYQRTTPVEGADPLHVRQLALAMWRARAQDSHKVAQFKDVLSVVAAVVFGFALLISIILVLHADFTI